MKDRPPLDMQHKDLGLFTIVVMANQFLKQWGDDITIASLHWKEFSKSLMASVDGLEQPSININGCTLWIVDYGLLWIVDYGLFVY